MVWPPPRLVKPLPEGVGGHRSPACCRHLVRGAIGPRIVTMRVLVQRVTQASVTVDDRTVGAIGNGLVALVGVTHGDTPERAARLAGKTARLRVFADEAGHMNRSLLDVDGSVLAVSQFTLYADTRRGNRPSFTDAAEPGVGDALYRAYVAAVEAQGVPVACGIFGAHMRIELVNDGPVTVMLEDDR
jgi:D-aminoacyl-tRNA deacylase